MTKTLLETNQNHPQIKAYKRAVVMGMKSQHVLPRDNSWIVRKGGATRATRVFETKSEAEIFARNVARNQGSSLFVHGRDGRIKDRKYYY